MIAKNKISGYGIIMEMIIKFGACGNVMGYQSIQVVIGYTDIVLNEIGDFDFIVP